MMKDNKNKNQILSSIHSVLRGIVIQHYMVKQNVLGKRSF